MIDRSFLESNPTTYYRDFLLATAVFSGAFVWFLVSDWPIAAVGWAIASIFLARAGIFGHEISHRPNDRHLKGFYWVWHLTIGAVILVPVVRFAEPHLTHHKTGVFATKDDPQYLLLRNNRALLIFVIFALPVLTPLFTLFQVYIASIGGVQLEERLDRFTRRSFNFSVSMPLPDSKKKEVGWLSRYYLLVFLAQAYFFPAALLPYYAVLVGAWFIIVLRIPLEHELEKYAETSGRSDQMRDSFTIESPLAVIIQPIGFRYHTAHHMYPGVPYHNLPALHAHLKETVPDYADSIVSYWSAICGPKKTTMNSKA